AISERRQADVGADGLGRLVVAAPAAGSVSLAEDAAGSPLGLKLGTVSGSFTGATVAGPTGAPPAIDVAFAAPLPQDGERLTITLGLPDGSSPTVSLTARSASRVGPRGFEAAVDADVTASYFQFPLTNS